MVMIQPRTSALIRTIGKVSRTLGD
jgi:hypothetical protein